MTKRTTKNDTPKNEVPAPVKVELVGLSEVQTASGKLSPMSAAAAAAIDGFTPTIYVAAVYAPTVFAAMAGSPMAASATGAAFGKRGTTERIVIGKLATGAYSWLTPGQCDHVSDEALTVARDAGRNAKLDGFDFGNLSTLLGKSARAQALR